MVKPGFAEQQADKNAVDACCTGYGAHVRKPCLHLIHRRSGLSKPYLPHLARRRFLMRQQYQFAAWPSFSCPMFLWVAYKGKQSSSHSTHRLLGGRVYFCLLCLHPERMTTPPQTKLSVDSVVPNRSSNKLQQKKLQSLCVPLPQY